MIMKYIFPIILFSLALLSAQLHADEKGNSLPPPEKWRQHIVAARGHFSEWRFREGEREYKAALEALEGLDNVALLKAKTLAELGFAYFYAGRLDQAEAPLQQSLTILKETVHHEHAHILELLNLLGTVYFEQRNYHKAEAVFQEALTILKETVHHEHVHILQTLNLLGAIYLEQGNYHKAEEALKQVVSADIKFSDLRQGQVNEALRQLASLYERVGRNDTEARQVIERAQRLARTGYILDYFAHARDAVEQGDWEAAYRLIEDYLLSEIAEVREGTQEFVKEHPKILQSAKKTFTVDSYTNTLSDHGDHAFEIEKERLAAYKAIASEKDYEEAEKSFHHFFHSQIKRKNERE